MVIYKITNIINLKIYIGQTTESMEKRWKRHTWDCTKRRNAMAITSVDDAISLEELNNKEEYYISTYNSMSPNGYNTNWWW